MSYLYNRFILKLNANFKPFALSTPVEVLPGLFSETLYGVDIDYQILENADGIPEPDYSQVESFDIVESWKAWKELEIRDWDFTIKTVDGEIRVPSVVICRNFKKSPKPKRLIPTKTNIWKRDSYYCQYTNEKLTNSTRSVDHVYPSSRGGKNTFENLVTCHKAVNVYKGNRTPEEAGLKLIREPKAPEESGIIFDKKMPQWEFLLK
jgi:5-methylcytosine-specific restriction endonuclease McrA